MKLNLGKKVFLIIILLLNICFVKGSSYDTISILKNIDFKEVWHNKKTTNELKENIWRYIQTLFIIGKTIINDSDKIIITVIIIKKVLFMIFYVFIY